MFPKMSGIGVLGAETFGKSEPVKVGRFGSKLGNDGSGSTENDADVPVASETSPADVPVASETEDAFGDATVAVGNFVIPIVGSVA
jgi:hypothetical protein